MVLSSLLPVRILAGSAHRAPWHQSRVPLYLEGGEACVQRFSSHLKHEISKLDGMPTHPKAESEYLSQSVFKQPSEQSLMLKRKEHPSHFSELNKPATIFGDGVSWFLPA